MEMILNELSAEFPAATREEGRRIMYAFLAVYLKAKEVIFNKSVLITEDYSGINLAEDSNIAQWRNDKEVDPEDHKYLFLGEDEIVKKQVEINNLSVLESIIRLKEECGDQIEKVFPNLIFL